MHLDYLFVLEMVLEDLLFLRQPEAMSCHAVVMSSPCPLELHNIASLETLKFATVIKRISKEVKKKRQSMQIEALESSINKSGKQLQV